MGGCDLLRIYTQEKPVRKWRKEDKNRERARQRYNFRSPKLHLLSHKALEYKLCLEFVCLQAKALYSAQDESPWERGWGGIVLTPKCFQLPEE